MKGGDKWSRFCCTEQFYALRCTGPAVVLTITLDSRESRRPSSPTPTLCSTILSHPQCPASDKCGYTWKTRPPSTTQRLDCQNLSRPPRVQMVWPPYLETRGKPSIKRLMAARRHQGGWGAQDTRVETYFAQRIAAPYEYTRTRTPRPASAPGPRPTRERESARPTTHPTVKDEAPGWSPYTDPAGRDSLHPAERKRRAATAKGSRLALRRCRSKCKGMARFVTSARPG